MRKLPLNLWPFWIVWRLGRAADIVVMFAWNRFELKPNIFWWASGMGALSCWVLYLLLDNSINGFWKSIPMLMAIFYMIGVHTQDVRYKRHRAQQYNLVNFVFRMDATQQAVQFTVILLLGMISIAECAQGRFLYAMWFLCDVAYNRFRYAFVPVDPPKRKVKLKLPKLAWTPDLQPLPIRS